MLLWRRFRNLSNETKSKASVYKCGNVEEESDTNREEGREKKTFLALSEPQEEKENVELDVEEESKTNSQVGTDQEDQGNS